MKMQIGQLGDVYELVLPGELVERFGLWEGQEINAATIEAAVEAYRFQQERERQEILKKIRGNPFSLPTGWKSSREEANAR